MIEPTQADRQRGATWASDQETAEKVLAGKLDSHPVVQAFAAARIEGAVAMREAAAGAITKDAKLCDCFAREESECACGAWYGSKEFSAEKVGAIIVALDPTTILRDKAT